MPPDMATVPLPDLSDSTAIVTGASSGLGLATARRLTDAGARVVLAVRDRAKGEAAARLVGDRAEVHLLDLADLSSVREFVTSWGERTVDLLINNAAAVSRTLQHTVDGFELQLGTNHLGHFALTLLLLPQVTGRVVTVSSQAERRGTLDWGDLTWRHGRYSSMKAYSRSKLANLLFTAELQHRLSAAGSQVRATAAHPGFVSTGMYAGTGPMTQRAVRVLAQSPEQGAQPVLLAAVGDVDGGAFVGPRGFGNLRGAPGPIRRSAAAQDPALASRLWSVSEQLTGVRWADIQHGLQIS